MLASGPDGCWAAPSDGASHSPASAATRITLRMSSLPQHPPRLYHRRVVREPGVAMSRQMTAELAERFARIALGHVGREFPNKLDQVLTGPGDLASPRALHPIFYGSFDWHSAVHSHWLLARVLRRFPELPSAGAIGAWLDQAFTQANVDGELAF